MGLDIQHFASKFVLLYYLCTDFWTFTDWYLYLLERNLENQILLNKKQDQIFWTFYDTQRASK